MKHLIVTGSLSNRDTIELTRSTFKLHNVYVFIFYILCSAQLNFVY